MKETIGKRIYDFLTLSCYLKLVGVSLIIVGLGLFAYCIGSVEHQFMLPSLIIKLQTMSNPLFYLILGFSLLCFRYFIIVTDKEGCE